MMVTDLGRYQQGDWVPLLVQSVDGNGLNAWPTATPIIDLFGDNDLTAAVETVRPAARDPNREIGLFMTMLRLSSTYVDRAYVASATWVISGSTFGHLLQFRVVAGGNEDGAVIGQTFIKRPGAGMIAWITDSGKLKVARNPR